MSQFAYALTDIKNNKRSYLFFLLQMIIVNLLIVVSLSEGLTTLRSFKALKRLSDLNAFRIVEVVDFGASNGITTSANLYDAFSELKNISADCYMTQCSYWVDDYNGNSVELYFMSSDFYSFFDLSVSSGNNLTAKDYQISYQDDLVPLVIGYDLMGRYHVGDIIPKNVLMQNMKFKVIGVLERNACFYSTISGEVSLNNALLAPFALNSVEMLDEATLDMLATNSVFCVKDKAAISGFVNRLNANNPAEPYRIEAYDEDIAWMIKICKDNVSYLMVIATILLLFAVLGMVVNLNTMIDKNMREFAVHILCGARVADILSRMLISVLGSILCAFFPVLLYTHDAECILFDLLLLFLISALVMLFPLIKLYSINTGELLKRRE